MSESCPPSSPPLMIPSASSSQPTTLLLSSSPPGFGRNAREETNEMIINSSNDGQTHGPTPTSRDGQTHGPTPTFSTHFRPLTDDTMPTASTPTLESLMHYIDRRIGEHETLIKSMLANHESAMIQKMEENNKAIMEKMMQKMEENNKAIMEKIEAIMAMHKEACSGGVNVELERELSRGVDTRYSGGDNFDCQQHPVQDEQIRDGGEYTHDRVVDMQADANIENVKKNEGRPERQRKRAAVLLSPYVVQLPKKIQHFESGCSQKDGSYL